MPIATVRRRREAMEDWRARSRGRDTQMQRIKRTAAPWCRIRINIGIKALPVDGSVARTPESGIGGQTRPREETSEDRRTSARMPVRRRSNGGEERGGGQCPSSSGTQWRPPRQRRRSCWSRASRGHGGCLCRRGGILRSGLWTLPEVSWRVGMTKGQKNGCSFDHDRTTIKKSDDVDTLGCYGP